MKFYKNLKLRTNDPLIASKQIRQTLKKYKVIKITPEWYLYDIETFYDNVTELIGNSLLIGEDFRKGGKPTGKKWLEIRYDYDIPDLAAYRHSKNAQPLHTDEAYVAEPGGIRFFYCVNKAAKGGATVFIDGSVLVDYLKNYDNELLEEIINSPIQFTKSTKTRKSKIIDIDSEGTIKLNYNYYRVDKDETEAHKALNQRFFEFLEDQIAHSYMMKKLVLRPGESLVWWDSLTLHGRDAYEAHKTNDRFIWKTGIEWNS